jgi:hypothetical protein
VLELLSLVIGNIQFDVVKFKKKVRRCWHAIMWVWTMDGIWFSWTLTYALCSHCQLPSSEECTRSTSLGTWGLSMLHVLTS